MKTLLRLTVSFLLTAAILAGCSFSGPPGIPRTGSTGTPQAASGYVAGTGYPPLATTVPGGGGGYPAPTTAPSATTAPVNTTAPTSPAPAATTAPGATAVPTSIPTTMGSEVPVTTGTAPAATQAPLATSSAGGGQNSIALPAQRKAIQFPANATSYVVNTNLQAGTTQAYQVYAFDGQRMYITIDGNATMQLYDPNLKPLSGVLTAINPVQISFSQTGNTYIALQGTGPVTMSVYIPPANGNQNIPAPIPAQVKTIQFPAGSTSTTFSENMTAGTPLAYKLNVQAGQQMTVTTAGNATVTLIAPDGATMVPSVAMPTHQWRYALSTGGNYTMVVLGSGLVSVTVTIPALSGGQPTAQPGGQGTAVPLPGSSTRVNFKPGNASTTFTTTLAAGTPQAYVLRVLAGQTLYVSTTGAVDVTIYGPGNAVLTNGHANYPNRWFARASQDGDYTFVISGNGQSTLTFYIPPQ